MGAEIIKIEFPHWAQEISVTLKRITAWVTPEFYLDGELISASGLSATFLFQPNSCLKITARPDSHKPRNVECAFYLEHKPVATNERKLGSGQTYDQTFLLVSR